MKITIKHKDTEIIVDTIESRIEDSVEAAERLYNLVTQQDYPQPSIIIPKEVTAKLAPFPQKDENFGIRERIPNNVVDVEKLDVKQAVTENALVRCPNCGQAHCLIVKDNNLYVMRKNYKTNEFEVVIMAEPDKINNLLCREGKYTAYFEDFQSMSAIPDIADFAVNNDTEIFCPVCHTSHKFIDWKNAWEYPLHFFETDSLCEICGGEVSVSVIKDGHSNGICNKCKSEVVNGTPVPEQ